VEVVVLVMETPVALTPLLVVLAEVGGHLPHVVLEPLEIYLQYLHHKEMLEAML
jgi:hypothetical protein